MRFLDLELPYDVDVKSVEHLLASLIEVLVLLINVPTKLFLKLFRGFELCLILGQIIQNQIRSINLLILIHIYIFNLWDQKGLWARLLCSRLRWLILQGQNGLPAWRSWSHLRFGGWLPRHRLPLSYHRLVWVFLLLLLFQLNVSLGLFADLFEGL